MKRPRNAHLAPTFVAILVAALAATNLEAQEKKPPKITYDDHVKPILRQKCFSCHNPDKKSSDLDVTNFTNLMAGGGSGEVIELGDSENSYLFMLVAHEDEPFMPPESEKLPDEMLETIRKWIDGGALENAGSKAAAPAKPKFDLALESTPTERPATVPMPQRLSLEPATRTTTTTAVTALATSPWAPLAAVAGQRQVLLYHTSSLELLGVLPFPEGVPQVLKFSRNGALLLAGGGRGGVYGRVVVWNVTTGARVFEIGDELDTVLAADISSDQSLVALGGPQRVVRIYSTATGQLLHELRKHTDWIYSLEFSPDSVLLATGDRNGGLFVWEAWTGREYLTLKAHTNGVAGVSWRTDSSVLASASEDGSVRLWEMENGRQIKNWRAHGGVACVEYARDGRLITCGRDRVTRAWDQNGKQLVAFEPFKDLALRATICDESNRVIAGDWTGAIRIWNAADGKMLGQWTGNPPKLAERLSAANRELTARQAAHEPLAEALVSAQSEVSRLDADITAARDTASEADKSAVAMNSEVKAANEEVERVAATHRAAQQTVASLEPGLGLLHVALSNAEQAVTKLSGDQEVTDLVAHLKAVVEARTTQLQSHRAAVKAADTELDEARGQLAAAEKRASDATTAVKSARSQLDKLAARLKDAQGKLPAAEKSAESSGSAAQAAQKAVDRWTDEIAFAERLRQAAK